MPYSVFVVRYNCVDNRGVTTGIMIEWRKDLENFEQDWTRKAAIQRGDLSFYSLDVRGYSDSVLGARHGQLGSSNKTQSSTCNGYAHL